MMPHFTPTNSFSACWASFARSSRPDVDAVEVLDGEGGGDLEGGRGGESRPLRDVPVDRDVHSPQLVAPRQELGDDPLGVVGPPVFLAEPKGGKGGALPVLVVDGIETEVVVLAAGDGHADVEIDGHREDKAVIVIGVLTDQVDSPGSAGDYLGRLAVLLGVALLHWIHA